jgi:hypothetical protein
VRVHYQLPGESTVAAVLSELRLCSV